jgi:hypothetical protein
VTRIIRRMGIALGSLVAALLVIWLLGSGQTLGGLAGVLVIVLGALIYRDIIRRDRRSP